MAAAAVLLHWPFLKLPMISCSSIQAPTQDNSRLGIITSPVIPLTHALWPSMIPKDQGCTQEYTISPCLTAGWMLIWATTVKGFTVLNLATGTENESKQVQLLFFNTVPYFNKRTAPEFPGQFFYAQSAKKANRIFLKFYWFLYLNYLCINFHSYPKKSKCLNVN